MRVKWGPGGNLVIQWRVVRGQPAGRRVAQLKDSERVEMSQC
jgi:hypothetical protein